jgi:hypothetical protein
MNLQLQQVGKQSSLHREVGKIPGGPTHAAEVCFSSYSNSIKQQVLHLPDAWVFLNCQYC